MIGDWRMERMAQRDPDLRATNARYARRRIDWRLFLGCIASFLTGVMFV